MVADLQLYYLALVLVIVLPTIFFGIKRSAPRRLPPGPWALPVVGHLNQLAGALPHRARRHGPLMALRLGELRAVVASSPSAVREVLKTHSTSCVIRSEQARGAVHGPTYVPRARGKRKAQALRERARVKTVHARRWRQTSPFRIENIETGAGNSD
ncbi:hypothetical protein PR202_gb06451 [Eleusine coracana subsp. coracana]|uniref:Uncharacterized protein n=1 Tax=Eleusine coracana subsp. coracana TaxID=191504 RepID=A0AAV5E9M2_ELECO|nr:hypothetical protein PR202_gb06451 [Eleusine coracana subsp. coracana]